MQLLDRKTEEGVTLLAKLAYGDIALVRNALDKRGEESAEAIINYIRDNRDEARRPRRSRAKHPDMPLSAG